MSDLTAGRNKRDALAAEMLRLGVRDGDVVEKFVLGSGPGGQKVNKTSSCVYLRHIPTGIEVKCRRTRSRELNRFFARRELCERIRQRREGEISARRAEIEKIRRRKRRRSQRQKQRMLEGKHRRSERKTMRRPAGADE